MLSKPGNKKDKFKEAFADAAASSFQTVYPDVYDKVGNNEVFNPEFIYEHLEKPKDPKMGRFALPVFRFTKLLAAKPQDIAQAVAGAMTIPEHVPITVEVAGGFINAKVDFSALAEESLVKILSLQKEYGTEDIGEGKTVIVEYSSVNIAKPFGIAHLRTTILGNSLRLILKKLGYNVIGMNYLGDWGTQFGKMIVAYRKWGNDIDLSDNPIEKLLELYVRFHEEARTNPELDDEARKTFKALESGDPETVDLWKRFKDMSLADYLKVYEQLGVEFDVITGESFLNDKMESLIERLEKAGLTSVSKGALIVDLHDPQLPPCLLKKADGATLYATRDIVGAFWRWEEYHFDEALYVVANSQSDHFKQVFKVIAMLEEAEQIPEQERIANRLKHVDFGWVKFGDKTMSTRSGNIIYLTDVINKAVTLARKKIREKNPGLQTIDKTAEMIGIGAVLFSQMSVRRLKDVNFIWEDVLNFEGETGPYLQYTHARLCSLLRNYDGEITSNPDVSLLHGEEEERIVELLADFPGAIRDAARNYDPYFIAMHLIKLAGAFNRFYQRKTPEGRIDKIISDDAPLTRARIALVRAVQVVINEGLRLLGIKAPEEM